MCNSFYVFAQEPAFIHFGLKEGLQTSEVYQSIQDSRGYMWFATDRGLVRFDGYEMKVFTEKEGLPSYSVFGFHKDYLDRIWLNMHRGGVCYLEGDSIVVPSFNDSLIKVIKGRVMGSIFFDRSNTLWLGYKQDARFIKVDSKSNIQEFMLKNDDSIKIKCPFILPLDSSGVIFGGKRLTDSQILHLKPSSKNEFLEYSYIDIPKTNYSGTEGFNAIKTSKGIYYSINEIIGLNNQAYAILPGVATMSLIEDRSNNIWVGFYNKGVICFENGDLQTKPKSYLSSNSVSHIYEDRHGGYWFTTLNEGIYYAPNIRFTTKKFSNSDRPKALSSLYINDKSIWVGTKSGEVFKQSIDLEKEERLIVSDLHQVKQIGESKNSIWIGIYSPFNFHGDLIDGVSLINSRAIWSNVNTDTLWHSPIARNDSVFEYINIANETLIKLSLKDKIIRATTRWKNLFYVGVADGIYFTKWPKNENWEKLDASPNYSISQLTNSDNYLFALTQNNGVLVYNGDTVNKIDVSNGLPTNKIETIFAENDTLVWLGSKKGLSRIEINQTMNVVKLNNITTSEGLINNEIYQIVKHQDKIYVATGDGLNHFNSNLNFDKDEVLNVQIKDIIVNNESIPIKDEMEFAHTAKVFDFNFIMLDYRKLGNIMYRYRLKGFDDQWTESKNRAVRYMMHPGNYSFEVMAKKRNGKWSAPSIVTFTVDAPLWKKTSFIVMSIICFLVLTFMIIRWQFNVKAKEAALELEMAKSQHTALSSQLKPHFIFNALNSINNFVQKNDVASSSKYLNLFSKLIRQVLANSFSPVASLEDEISLLEKYLQIEQLRFKEKMSYEINIADEIEPANMNIPSQIMQPHVENAIWHGIMQKEDNGCITISFSMQKENLLCVIEDDGVGRQATIAKKNVIGSKHKSFGMEISDKRMHLIKAIFKQEALTRVIDRKNDFNKAIGTRVELILPVIK